LCDDADDDDDDDDGLLLLRFFVDSMTWFVRVLNRMEE